MRHGAVMEPSEPVPVAVSAEWRSTAVTTDPPRSAEHLVWTVALKLAAATPLRAVALLAHGREAHWAFHPGEPALEVEILVLFDPWRFRTSDAVAISCEGRQVQVTDAGLKHDPRDGARIVAPERTRTREVTDFLQLPGHGISLAFAALADDDTETRPLGRWRIAPALVPALPGRLAPLASGYQSGTLIS
jgi:hypothetical protein